MNVSMAHTTVNTSATTLRGPTNAAVTMDTGQWTTEGLVQIRMNVYWAHTAVNSCA